MMKEEVRTLGDILHPRGEKAQPSAFPHLPYVGMEHVEAHTGRLLGTVPASEMKSTANRFYVGDVLYGRLRPYLNKVWRADREGLCSTEVIVMPGTDLVDTGYIRYRLNSPDFVSFATHLNAGDRPRVDFDQISSFQTFLPSSLSAQRRIVGEIEKQFTRLEAGVAALRRVQANLHRYRAAVLKAACEGKLVENEVSRQKAKGRSVETGKQLLQRILKQRRDQWAGKGKYKEPTAPDTTGLSKLPDGWCWATVEQLGDVQLGRQRSPKNRSQKYPTKYLRAANITEKGIDLSDVLDMEFTPDEKPRYELHPGDPILSEASGSPDQVGKPAVCREEHASYCFQNTVIRHRPAGLPSDYLLTTYKNYYVNGKFAQVAGGVGINHLSAAKFSKICIPLPPVAEQERIVAEVERRLSVVEELSALVTANLQRATRLRQSILQRAFEGQL